MCQQSCHVLYSMYPQHGTIIKLHYIPSNNMFQFQDSFLLHMCYQSSFVLQVWEWKWPYLADCGVTVQVTYRLYSISSNQSLPCNSQSDTFLNFICATNTINTWVQVAEFWGHSLNIYYNKIDQFINISTTCCVRSVHQIALADQINSTTKDCVLIKFFMILWMLVFTMKLFTTESGNYFKFPSKINSA